MHTHSVISALPHGYEGVCNNIALSETYSPTQVHFVNVLGEFKLENLPVYTSWHLLPE